MRVLSFGHIPSWAGGKQESGLANVIYQLAKYESFIHNVEVYLAATDSCVPNRYDGDLCIIGWTKRGLLWSIISHPCLFVNNICVLRKLKKQYPLSESFVRLLFKRMFLIKSIRKVTPSIIHLHGTAAIWYLDLIPASVKVALTFHGMTGLDENIQDYKILFEMERDAFHSRKVDGVFFICTQLVDSFVKAYGANGKNNTVIFNSYDQAQFYFEKNELSFSLSKSGETVHSRAITLCTVASLSDLKGQFRVLSGLKDVSDRKRFKYICIGGDSDSYSEVLTKYAEENDIPYQYLGEMPPGQIRKYLMGADYMIMPSSSEGFGLTYLEAIACGVPVILPKYLPIAQEKELINDKNSIMLENCSSEAITKVLNNIDNYSFNRESVAETISAFSWADAASQYIKAYNRL